ncbi:MAG: hypothetical protein AAGG68_14965 [Bacteroidota bacterium]
MKRVRKLTNDNLYMELQSILRIASQAAAKARLENRKYGIPRIFSKNQKLYFELENGKLTTERPEVLSDKK